MALVPPNLDDRGFHDLVSSAKDRIALRCPDWTDLSPHDPGIALLEAFAHVTETMIYRLNRLPEKVYVELLRLISVNIKAPTAALTTLRFELSDVSDRPVEVPEGTRVSTQGSSGKKTSFTTSRSVSISPGEKTVDVTAHSAEFVNGDFVGWGTGLPGHFVKLRKTPIVAKSDDALTVVIGVEATEEEIDQRAPARTADNKIFRIWREIENFNADPKDNYVFVVDRITGTVTFPPAARLATRDGLLADEPTPLGSVPPKGREIRAWYFWGGGAAGNLPVGALNRVDSSLALPRAMTVSVSNISTASGGHAAESLENALTRGPIELRSLERAVTALDFEQLALTTSRDVARARAYAAAQVWKHAPLGTVEVLVVPAMTETDPPTPVVEVPLERLLREQDEERRSRLQRELDRRRPIGTLCHVKWARYKPVTVKARVVVHRGEDTESVKRRLLERLHMTINPLPTKLRPLGWGFGQPLRNSDVYDLLLNEPGVKYADELQLVLDRAPENCTVVEAARTQPGLWFAGSGRTVFRSMNSAKSWEPLIDLPGKEIQAIATHPDRAGFLAVAIGLEQEDQSKIFWSFDAGENWEKSTHTLRRVNSLCWMIRDTVPVLLMATDVGLFDLSLPNGAPLQVLVDPANPERGFYSVAVAAGERGAVKVALAAKGSAGVYLSVNRGEPGTYKLVGLAKEDVRVLEVQYDQQRSFLWAAAAAQGGGDPGKGCWRWELTGAGDVSPDGWVRYGKGWTGGSCFAITFLEADNKTFVLAGTHEAGVLRLDPRAADPAWVVSEPSSGLPMRNRERLFHRIRSLSSDGKIALAGMEQGIFSARELATKFEPASLSTFTERVMIPPSSLICSGPHELTVVSEDEAS
jgi:hypothetical protein